MARVVLIGGAPTTGKSSLARACVPEFDTVIEFDFLFDAVYRSWFAATPHLFSKNSFSASPSETPRFASPDEHNESVSRHKFVLAAKLVQDLIETARQDGRDILIEGWMLAPGYIAHQHDVSFFYLSVGEEELRRRLRAEPFALSEGDTERVVALDAQLKALCSMNQIPVKPSAFLAAQIANGVNVEGNPAK